MDNGAIKASLDTYNALRSGSCEGCWSKKKPVNEYDLCEDCDKLEITDKSARFHVQQLFDLLHKQEISDYEESLFDAYKEDDLDGLRIIAEEFKDLCFSYGTGGKIYIEDRVLSLRNGCFNKGTMGDMLNQAFSWWGVNLQLTDTNMDFPPKPPHA